MATATILVVDDHQYLLDLMKAILSRSAYHVLTADSSGTALNVLRSTPRVDLVISDADLPGQNGSDLVHSVRQSFPSTAVMLMTAYSERLLDPEIPCLEKPFTSSTLIFRVQRVLQESGIATVQLGARLSTTGESLEQSRQLRGQLRGARSEVQNAVRRSRRMRWERTLRQSDPSKPVILIVENDAAFLHTISRSLLKNGFLVLDAATHDDAFELWRDHHARIRAVVTGLHGVDGLALAKAVESDFPEQPIFFITTSDTSLPHPTFRKPFEMDDLVSALRHAIARK